MNVSETTLEAQDLNQQASVLLHAGHVEEAQAKLDQAIELDPMVMASYKNYGDLYMHLEDYEKALSMFKKALLIEKSGDLYFACGNAYFMNQDPQNGLEYYNLAIGAGFDTDNVLFFMGLAYEHIGDDAMALRYFQKACVKSPARVEFQVKKIQHLMATGIYTEAEESLNHLIDVAPELYDGYHLKTILLTQLGRAKEATQFSQMAAQRFPEDASLLLDYVRSLTLENSFDLALEHLGRAKQLKYFDNVKPDFFRLEGQIKAEQGDFDGAQLCLDQCIQATPDGEFDGEAHFLKMSIYVAQKDYENALTWANLLVGRERKNDQYFAALYYQAYCAKALGHDNSAQLYKNAIFTFRGETLVRPEAIDIYLYRCMCLKDTEQYEKALELLEFVDRLTGSLAEVHALRSDIYRLMGRDALSATELEKAYKLKPELRPQTEEKEG